ncbi:MAG: 2,3-bisphosphoglycerate-independent phosphoglycerate mutase [Pseudomonadota bacterium]
MPMPHKPVVLAILDGWGLSETEAGNAVRLAHTPHIDRVFAEHPSARLAASGEDVGLPPGQIGNSEVGHTNIGAGRVVWMDLPRIDRAIEDGAFAANPALVRFCQRLQESGGTAHLVGLASPGGVHAHQRHLVAAARVLAGGGIPVALHLITDGRDVGPKTARAQIAGLLEEIAALEGVRAASVIGRFYTLDRDKRWERVQAAFATMVHAEGTPAKDALTAIDTAYARDESDEFITPTPLAGHTGMAHGDGLFCLNFRADRAREILSALVDPDFDAFETGARPRFAAQLGMVEYSERLDGLLDTVFASEPIANTLGAWVAAHGLSQMRLAETEKYPHVTFFLNGGRETPAQGEHRHMAQSPRVRTYDLAPEMAAGEVTEALVEAIRARHALIVVNFANPDMVGHTGDLQAAIRACEAVDVGMGRALVALAEVGGAMLVTADHGNCECMVAPDGTPHTAHTTNPVPVGLVECPPTANKALRDGRLADLAPTLLTLMGLDAPAEMTGRSLILDEVVEGAA